MENTTPAVNEKKLPTLQELHYDLEKAYENDAFNKLLNAMPPDTWLKPHPTATREIDTPQGKQKVPVLYMPIEKVEHLLTKIFQEWHVEILREGQLFQSLFVTVRLHVKNILTGEWTFNDGTGAVDVQTEKGASAADLSKIRSGAVMKGLPSAESYAIKDAAEKFGRIFGKDINRSNSIEFTGSYSPTDAAMNAEKTEVVPLDEEIKFAITVTTTNDELDDAVGRFLELRNNIEFKKIVTDQRKKLIGK